MDKNNKVFNFLIKRRELIISIFFGLSFIALKYNINNYIFNFFIAMSGIFSVIYLALFFEKFNLIWLETLGIMSMQIYLLHIFPSGIIRAMFKYYFHFNNPYLYIPFLVISSLIIPIVIYDYAKKLSIHRYLFGR